NSLPPKGLVRLTECRMLCVLHYSCIVKRPIECAAPSYKIVTVDRFAIVAKLDTGIVPDSCYSDFTAVEVNNISVTDCADFFDCFHSRKFCCCYCICKYTNNSHNLLQITGLFLDYFSSILG